MSLQIDVAWVPSELPDVADEPHASVVIDAIRATTSISTALGAGAARVIPVERVDEARATAPRLDALLCGEREGLPPDGFDLGNSPGAYTSETVSGRTLVFTTSNGTGAMRRALLASPDTVRLACFRNLDAVARALAPAGAAETDRPIRIVCAGRLGRVSMDDAWCAGHLVRRLVVRIDTAGLTDGARTALELADRLGAPTTEGLLETAAGRALAAAGLENDLADCARVDDLDIVPVWVDGAFVQGRGEDGI